MANSTLILVRYPWMFLSHGTSSSGKSPYLSVLDTELDLLNRNVEIYPARHARQLLLFAIGKLPSATISVYFCLIFRRSSFFERCEKVIEHKQADLVDLKQAWNEARVLIITYTRYIYILRFTIIAWSIDLEINIPFSVLLYFKSKCHEWLQPFSRRARLATC